MVSENVSASLSTGRVVQGKTNYNCVFEDPSDTYCLNLRCDGICFVDSHFVRCIFIWRCRRIPTHPAPSPAKSLYRASSWPQVELPEGGGFDLQIKLIRLDPTQVVRLLLILHRHRYPHFLTQEPWQCNPKNTHN